MRNRRHLRLTTKPKHSNMTKINHKQDITSNDSEKIPNSNNQTWLKDNHVWRESPQARHPTDMVNGNSHKMNTSDFCMYGGCWSTYIHKRPKTGNALRGLFSGTQSENDGSNKARMLSHMSLGVISTKHIGYREFENFYLIFGSLSDLRDMMCWSREERTTHCGERCTSADTLKLEENPPP